MQQVKQYLGNCVIYAAALEAPSGDGFVAAALVLAQGQSSAMEVFRDNLLEDGQVWPDPMEAVKFATRVGNAAAGLYEARIIAPEQNQWVHRMS